MKKVILIVFGLTIAAVAVIIFTFFEYKEVPLVKWRETYLPADKEPYGTWMFRNLLDEKYGADNVVHRYRDIDLMDIDEDENCLLIMMGNRINLDWEETNSLANFSNDYNDVLIIASSIDFDYDWGLTDWSTRLSVDTSIVIHYPSMSDQSFDFSFKDGSLTKSARTYYRTFDSGDLLVTHMDSLVTLTPIYDITYSEVDSVVVALETEENDETSDESDYEDDYEDDYSYEDEEDYDYDDNLGYILGIDQDSASIYKEWDFDGYTVGIHTVPEMFTNVAAHQDFYLDHFNQIIGDGDYDKVIFEHPSFNSDKLSERESPIQFILDNASLKWSYYTLLVGALLYVIFRGKRKQRIVPTLAPNNNTSLEYVQTLGSLYEHQGQPRKLVRHMSDIFYHDVKGRYNLDHHDDNFVQKLSKKSNISEQEINLIVKTFSTIDGRFDFTDVDLSNLYRRLDAFYKNCK